MAERLHQSSRTEARRAPLLSASNLTPSSAALHCPLHQPGVLSATVLIISCNPSKRHVNRPTSNRTRGFNMGKGHDVRVKQSHSSIYYVGASQPLTPWHSRLSVSEVMGSARVQHRIGCLVQVYLPYPPIFYIDPWTSYSATAGLIRHLYK